jgi:xylose dehydrogenase (NAD/NADP)
MRVVIVGAGNIAYRHAAGCRELDGAELVAVCDVRRDAADRLADQFGVAARYTDLQTLLANEQPDVAIVATWGSLHAEVVEQLARSGRVKAILCEKPLATNAPQAEAMFKVAAECGVLLAEAFRLRNQPIHLRAIDVIRSGRIGQVVHVRNAMMWTLPPEDKDPTRNWRFNKPVGGGVTYDIGCYCINQLRWAMADEPETVFATGRWGSTGVDEHVAGVATFSGGRSAEWCVSWQAGPAHVAEVLGTDGVVRLENAWGDDAQGVPTATQLEIVDSQRNREIEEFPRTDQFWLQLRHMQDCVENGAVHRIPPADSIAQMRVIDAVYESLKTGQPAQVARA